LWLLTVAPQRIPGLRLNTERVYQRIDPSVEVLRFNDNPVIEGLERVSFLHRREMTARSAETQLIGKVWHFEAGVVHDFKGTYEEYTASLV